MRDTVRATSLTDTGARHRLPSHFRLPLALSPRSGSADIFLTRTVVVPVVHPEGRAHRRRESLLTSTLPELRPPPCCAGADGHIEAYAVTPCGTSDLRHPIRDATTMQRTTNFHVTNRRRVLLFFFPLNPLTDVSARASACHSNSSMTTSCPIDAARLAWYTITSERFVPFHARHACYTCKPCNRYDLVSARLIRLVVTHVISVLLSLRFP